MAPLGGFTLKTRGIAVVTLFQKGLEVKVGMLSPQNEREITLGKRGLVRHSCIF